ncbi:MAG TPA: hypothetical protein VEU47_19095 [Candidatus Cybelea sp.]|nr:hypothetical protein [Candidatus Cybelea sp.]
MAKAPKQPGEAEAEDQDDVEEQAEVGTETEADDAEIAGAEGEQEGDDAAAAEGEGEVGDEEESEVDERPRKLTARERVQQAVNRAKAAEEEAARERTRREELERVRNQPDPAAEARREAAEEEAARLEGPEAVARLLTRRSEARISQQIGVMQFQQADIADRSEFREFLLDHPRLKDISKEVEDRLAQYRRNGVNPKRTEIAKLVLGERALQRGPAAAERQRRQGRERIAAETTRRGTGAGGSDVRRTPARANDDSLEATEARLRARIARGQNI